jgi:hypothetical protein
MKINRGLQIAYSQKKRGGGVGKGKKEEKKGIKEIEQRLRMVRKRVNKSAGSVKAGSSDSPQFHPCGLRTGSSRTLADSLVDSLSRTLTDTCGPSRTLTDPCGPLRTLADPCGPLRTLADPCEPLRTLADRCGPLRTLADH